MKHLSFSTLLVVFCFVQVSRAQEARQSLPPIEVFFSPNGGCTDAVVKELGSAKSSVLVQAYSFTSVPIAKALVDAYKQGVKIEVILDKCQKGEKYSSADFVINAGIPTKIDAKHAIAHTDPPPPVRRWVPCKIVSYGLEVLRSRFGDLEVVAPVVRFGAVLLFQVLHYDFIRCAPTAGDEVPSGPKVPTPELFRNVLELHHQLA